MRHYLLLPEISEHVPLSPLTWDIWTCATISCYLRYLNMCPLSPVTWDIWTCATIFCYLRYLNMCPLSSLTWDIWTCATNSCYLRYLNMCHYLLFLLYSNLELCYFLIFHLQEEPGVRDICKRVKRPRVTELSWKYLTICTHFQQKSLLSTLEWFLHLSPGIYIVVFLFAKHKKEFLALCFALFDVFHVTKKLNFVQSQQ